MHRGTRIGALAAVMVAAVAIAIFVVAYLRSRVPHDAADTAADTGGAIAARRGPDAVAVAASAPVAIGSLDGKVFGVDGAPRAGMIVALRGEDVRRAMVTDDTGAFAMRDLPAGMIHVSASAPDGSAAVTSLDVVLNATAHVELRLVARPGTASLRGRVRDLVGGPVAGAEVWVGSDTDGPTSIVTTGSDGGFSTRVAKGDHELRVRAAGYAEAGEDVAISGDLFVDVVVHPAASIHGVVVANGRQRRPWSAGARPGPRLG